ncbi:MAG: M20/M25/M40 family metallo-hydrolase [Planctomycetota bacterium]
MRRWVLRSVGGALLLLVAVLLGRMFTFRMHEVDAPPVALDFDADRATAHLSEALRHRTVSSPLEEAAFEDFHAWLRRTYPRVHDRLAREALGLSLLYTWSGSEPERPPVLLMAHQDVVDAATPDRWTHPPFLGTVADGHVWGRGALDMKTTLVALFEATEALLEAGYRPRRTVLLALGHDEEVEGGGNRAIAEHLRRRGTRLRWILDEGLGVFEQNYFSERPAALVGIAEKGVVSLELIARSEGGHSSAPPAQSTVDRVARAIHRLRAHPAPARVVGGTRAMLEHFAPEMPFLWRISTTNLWLLESEVTRYLARRPATDALIRTTVAATVFSAGTQPNVLPTHARAVVHFRLLTGEDIAGTLARATEVIDDPEVTVRILPGAPRAEPSPVSRLDGPGYRAVERAVRAVYPDTLVGPGLLVSTTDSRHYVDLAEDTYRFMPLRFGSGDAYRAHGIDERIRVANVADAVRFYAQLIREADRD